MASLGFAQVLKSPFFLTFLPIKVGGKCPAPTPMGNMYSIELFRILSAVIRLTPQEVTLGK
jgi:hypothetical protein